MPSDLYKCMYVISKDEYENMKDNIKNNVDSGIGGNVTDSHVHNIDVSGGGTLVINDSHPPHNSHTKNNHNCHSAYVDKDHHASTKRKQNGCKGNSVPPARAIGVPSNNIPMLIPPSIHPSSTRSYASPSNNLQNANILPNSYVAPATPMSIDYSSIKGNSKNTFDNSKLPSPFPPPVLSSTKLPAKKVRKDTFNNPNIPSPMPPPVLSSTRKGSSSSISRKISTSSANTQTRAAKHPTRVLNPMVMQKSRNLLKQMMKNRLSELTGQPVEKQKKSSSVTASEIIHDLRKLHNNRQPVTGYNLDRRRTDRYRLQKVPFSVYRDESSSFVPLPYDPEFDNSKPTRQLVKRSGCDGKPVPRKVTKRKNQNTTAQNVELDPFQYEPRKKIANVNYAPVRHVGNIARVKRKREDDNEDYILDSCPYKRQIRDCESSDEDL